MRRRSYEEATSPLVTTRKGCEVSDESVLEHVRRTSSGIILAEAMSSTYQDDDIESLRVTPQVLPGTKLIDHRLDTSFKKSARPTYP